MAEKFSKFNQYFVAPGKKERGLTATSASFLAGLASQEVNRLEKLIQSAVYYDAYLEPLTGDTGPRLVQKGKDEAFLEELLPAAKQIGELRGFMAYVHEAVKEKVRQTRHLDSMTFEDWLDLPENKAKKEELEKAEKDLKAPEAPEQEPPADLEWAKAQLSVKELAHYLLMEAEASTLGIYIHPDGVLAKAKDDLSEKAVRPIEQAGYDSADTVTIRSYKPSLDPEKAYQNYHRLQNTQRLWESEVNALKAKLEILVKNESLARNRAYREALAEYEKKLADHRLQIEKNENRKKALQTEYADWLLAEHEAVRNLKIIVPKELQEVYERLSSLGK